MTRADRYRQIMEKLPIRNKMGQTVPLRFNAAQELVWTKHIAPALNQKKKVWLLILKARQMGMSTLCEALLMARTVLEEHVHCLVMAHQAPNTEEILSVSKRMVTESPLAQFGRPFKDRIIFGNSYMKIATAGTKSAARTYTLTGFHGSEIAFWDRPETLDATMNCLPSELDTFCFLESTANGKIGQGQMFYEEWQRAARGDSDFIAVFLPWFVMPEYAMPDLPITDLDTEELAMRETLKLTDAQLSWRRWCIRANCKGSLALFRQEYPTTPDEAFISSGRPFFQPEQLYFLRPSIVSPQRFRVDERGTLTPDKDGPVRVWKEPNPNQQYVIGCDSSMGLEGKSYSKSTMEVIDMVTLEQVAEYEASTPPHILAKHLVGLGIHYSNALLAPEVTSSGGGGGRELLVYVEQLHYYNVHRKSLQAGKIGPRKANEYGWETNNRTRPRMIARIQECIHEQSVTLHSAQLLSQLQNFGQNDEGRFEAIHGHDDLLFAFGIALMSRSENYHPKIKQAAQTRPDLSGHTSIAVIDEYEWLRQQLPQPKTSYLSM